MVYSDSLSFFSGIGFVDNDKKENTSVQLVQYLRDLKGKEISFSSGYFIAQSKYSCNLTLQIKVSINRENKQSVNNNNNNNNKFNNN